MSNSTDEPTYTLPQARREMEARGYAQIADDYTSADRKRVARRRNPDWGDE